MFVSITWKLTLISFCITYKRLYYIRIYVFERIDDKTIESKECDICHYGYFLVKGFKFYSILNQVILGYEIVL